MCTHLRAAAPYDTYVLLSNKQACGPAAGVECNGSQDLIISFLIFIPSWRRFEQHARRYGVLYIAFLPQEYLFPETTPPTWWSRREQAPNTSRRRNRCLPCSPAGKKRAESGTKAGGGSTSAPLGHEQHFRQRRRPLDIGRAVSHKRFEDYGLLSTPWWASLGTEAIRRAARTEQSWFLFLGSSTNRMCVIPSARWTFSVGTDSRS